ncbi:MAG: 4a-hydroxytetrahydrobiopterin dehydratase [Pseudomonadota bacterium]
MAPLDMHQAAELKTSLEPEWSIVDDGRALYREIGFAGFNRTMAFANAVAWIANTEGHHPVMCVRYGRCDLTWTTNAINGLSVNDFICAAKVDQLLHAV